MLDISALAQPNNTGWRVHAEKVVDYAPFIVPISDFRPTTYSFSLNGKVLIRYVPVGGRQLVAIDSPGEPQRLILQAGQPLSDADPRIVANFGQETIDNAGVVRVRVALSDVLNGPFVENGVLEVLPNNSKRFVLSNGAPVPGIEGATFATLEPPYVACNSDGWVGVQSRIRLSGSSTPNSIAIALISPAGQMSLLAQQGSQVNGYPQGWTYSPRYLSNGLLWDQLLLPLTRGTATATRVLALNSVLPPTGPQQTLWHVGGEQALLSPLTSSLQTLPGIVELALVNEFWIQSVREDGRFVAQVKGITHDGESATLLVAGTPDDMRTVARIGDVVVMPFGPKLMTDFSTADCTAPASRTTSGAQFGEMLASISVNAPMFGRAIVRFVPGQPPQPIVVPGWTQIQAAQVRYVSSLISNDDGKALIGVSFEGGGGATLGWSPQQGLEVIAINGRTPFFPGAAQPTRALGAALV
jgi:hypothetical protein